MPTNPGPIPTSRFSLHSTELAGGGLADDVRRGLTAARKTIPPHHFYDELGSVLFDAICKLPEYYVTRAESEIFDHHAVSIAAAFEQPARVIELGAGTARKTRLLLDQLREAPLKYVPIDVDATLLERVGSELVGEYANLQVSAVCGDFRNPSIPIAAAGPVAEGRTVVLFLGSSIGNLEHDEAVDMLRDLRRALHPGDLLLLGADLRKAKSILEPAYDDALGVTASFNRNLLQRINRELGGQFDLRAFTHRASYDEALGRIEMHLVSNGPQSVRIEALDLDVTFEAGETIHTESSHKYDTATLETLAASSGFTIAGSWTDAAAQFVDVLFVAG